MNFWNIDYLMVVIYLTAMLVVGLFVGRNITTLKDYAIAGKQYSTPVLMLTMMATMMGGGTTTGNTSMIYNSGIIWVVTSISVIISMLVIAKFVAPHFDERFEGMLSSGDIIKYFYGAKIEKVASLACVFGCILITTAQLIALGHAFNVFLNLDYKWGVILAGGTLVIYSAFGGIKSVTVTDVIQFAILIVMVPIIASVAIHDVGGIGAVFTKAPASHFKVFDHPDFYEYLAIFLLELMPFTILYPSAVQRFLMAKNPKQISLIVYVYATLHGVILLTMTCIAFAAVIKYPEIEPKRIIPTIVNDLLPVGIKGMATVGMLAVIMSTADSFLNTATILLMKNFGFSRIAHGKNLIFMSRMSAFIVGMMVILVALSDYSIVSLLIAVEAVLAVMVTAPMFFGIMRIKVDAKCYWANLIAAGLAYACCTHIDLAHFITALVVPAVGIFAFFAVHITYNKKIVFTHAYGAKNLGKNSIVQKVLSSSKFKNIFSIRGIVDYSAQAVGKYGADYILFGAFCSINYILPYFMWTYDQSSDYLAMLNVRVLSGFLCVGLLLKDYWPKSLRKYLPVYWHISLMICLPFSTTAMFLINHASYEWLINIAFSIMLLVALVDWLSFICIMMMGALLGIIYYEFLITDIFDWNITFSQGYLAIYTLIFATLIGFLFLRRKEIYNEERIGTMQLFGSAIAHEVRNPMSAIYSSAETANLILKEAERTKENNKVILEFEKRDYEAMLLFLDNTMQISKKGIKMVEVLLQSLKSKIDAADVDIHSVYDCITGALKTLSMDKEQSGRVKLQAANGHDITFHGSKIFVEHVFVNLIKNALQYAGKNAIITITLAGNKVEVSDNGYGISEEKLPLIFQRFYSGNDSTGIGLAFCKMVMDELEGGIECESVVNNYTKFTLYFPER